MTTITHDLGHGMGNDWEYKDWAHLTVSELHNLQPYYPCLQGGIQILWCSPRPFSSAAVIEVTQDAASTDKIGSRSYFIKRSHRSFRNAQDILQEHAFLRHLASKNIPVATLIASNYGLTALEMGDWTYEVYEKAAGFDLYVDQQSWTPFFYTEHAAKVGSLLAKLHVAMQDFPELHGRSARYLVSNQQLLESENIVTAIQQRIQNSPELSRYFADKNLDTVFLERVSQTHHKIKHVLQQVTKIWTHNDLHASNLFWSTQSADANITAVIDFGLSDRNSALYDLAVTIERNFIDWLALEHTLQINIDEAGLSAFLQAYFAEIHPQQDFSILPGLLKIVHLDFAFSELEYFVGITQNLKHADAAYYDWIVGHVNWFFAEQGQQFTQTFTRLIQRELS
ncbi:phosphotransferase enzyme family protein [Acinetobacter towneri]|uniref:Phosphotransferase n=1 Tax=Acinetobacter towneri TaxID=202956 RepID=A0ABX7TBU2_9GAMM|nr:phosphotransferase [Acinetobacter towneri]QTD58412.1 phosphotransferase [Acinetobacter towneri]QTD60778.1 phosphotransferase [Acinetobacter towneri]